MSGSKNLSDEKQAVRLLHTLRKSSLLKPLSDSTTHVLDTYPERHHTSLDMAHPEDCAYNDLFKTLYGNPNALNATKHTIEELLKEQKDMRAEWRITGTKLLPWPLLQFENLTQRLLNIVINLVNTVMGKRRMLNWA